MGCVNQLLYNRFLSMLTLVLVVSTSMQSMLRNMPEVFKRVIGFKLEWQKLSFARLVRRLLR